MRGPAVPGVLLAAVLAAGGPGVTPPLGAEELTPAQMEEALVKAPWPGMLPWDAMWARDLVWRNRWVEVRRPGEKPSTLWLKDVRGLRQENGLYTLRINGEKADLSILWISYGGEMMNLQALFSYGAGPTTGLPAFRDRF